jgi:hypothetical protein
MTQRLPDGIKERRAAIFFCPAHYCNFSSCDIMICEKTVAEIGKYGQAIYLYNPIIVRAVKVQNRHN